VDMPIELRKRAIDPGCVKKRRKLTNAENDPSQMNPGKSGQVVIPLIRIFKYLRPPVTID